MMIVKKEKIQMTTAGGGGFPRLARVMTCLMLLLMAATQGAWADEQLVYTLDGTQTGGTSAYTTENEITQGGIAWGVVGNTTMNPWRIGGKSLTGTDRPVYSTNVLEGTVTKVTVDLGDNNGVDVNSFTLTVASDANFASVIDTKTATYAANSAVDFTPTAGKEWTNAYYRFVFNVSVEGSSNKYLQFISAKFYSASQGGGDAAKYTRAVAISELKVGDILAQGASITGESSDAVNLDPNRSKAGNEVVGTEVGLNLTVSFGTNGTINNQYAPVTESGQDGDAWVVTKVVNQFGIYTVNLAGILMTGGSGDASTYTATLAEGTEDAANWTITPNSGLSEGDQVTIQYSGTRRVRSVTATVSPAASGGEAAGITDPQVGQVIGSDGKNYAADATLPSGVTAVAKIFYVGSDAETSTTYNHGLALALADVSGTQEWCSQYSATCLTAQFSSEAAAKADMAGIANTDALVGHGSHTHAAASAARGYNGGVHPAGTSEWFLPSAGQWDKMITAAGGYATLKTNAGLKMDNYQSSSERDAGNAWSFYANDGRWYNNSKNEEYSVRACLAF